MLFELLTLISLVFNFYLYREITRVEERVKRVWEKTEHQSKAILTILDMGKRDFELIKYNRKVCDAISAAYGVLPTDVSKKA